MKFYPLSHNKGRKCPYGHLITVFRPTTLDYPIVLSRSDLKCLLGSEWRIIIAAHKLGALSETYALALLNVLNKPSEIRVHLLLVQSHVPCSIGDIAPYICKLSISEFQGHLA